MAASLRQSAGGDESQEVLLLGARRSPTLLAVVRGQQRYGWGPRDGVLVMLNGDARPELSPLIWRALRLGLYAKSPSFFIAQQASQRGPRGLHSK